MTLTIEGHVHDAMLAAARRALPAEACGLLGGRGGLATAFYGLSNADASGEHYSMLPEEQFAAIKDMRGRDLAMQAIWHSHPATPARMSEEDLRLAYTPDVVYLILSLASPTGPDLRGYVMQDDEPTEVAVTVADASYDGGDTGS